MSLDFSLYAVRRTNVFDANITHNLTSMAKEAGIYLHLWRGPEAGFKIAADIIPALKEGIELMEAHPDRFRKFDDPADWGTYDQFLPWVKRVLAACEANPDAEIGIYR